MSIFRHLRESSLLRPPPILSLRKCGSTNRPLIEPIVYLAAHELEDSRSSKNYLLFLKTASISHIISTNRNHAKSIFTIGKLGKKFAAEDVVGEVDGGDPANRSQKKIKSRACF